MSIVLKEFVKGIVLRGENSDITDNIEGSIFYNQTEKRFKAYINNAIQYIVTSPTSGGGGGGGAETDLSNLTSPTAIPNGVDLISNTTTAFTVTTKNSNTGNTSEMRVTSGIASGSGNTGALTYYTGKANSGLSGGVYVSTGPIDNVLQGVNNETNTSPTGNIQINSGIIRNTASSSRTGNMYFGSGSSSSTVGSGFVTITSGNIVAGGTGGSGGLVLTTGFATSGNTGNINIETGTTTTGNRGSIYLVGKEYIYSSSASNPIYGGQESGAWIRRGLTIGPPGYFTADENYIHLQMDYGDPRLWIGAKNPPNAYSITGQLWSLNGSGGGMIFRGAAVRTSIDGNYKGSDVILESYSVDVGESTAANWQIDSGNVYVQSLGGSIKGTGTGANSGSLEIKTGASAGTGNSGAVRITTGDALNGTPGNIELRAGLSTLLNRRGDLIVEASTMYADGGGSILLSTFNQIVFTDLDLLRSGTVYHKNLSANTNLQFINGVPGKRFTVVVKNITASSLSVFFPTVKEKAGTIVNTVAANSSNIYEFVNSNNEYYCISCITNLV